MKEKRYRVELVFKETKKVMGILRDDLLEEEAKRVTNRKSLSVDDKKFYVQMVENKK